MVNGVMIWKFKPYLKFIRDLFKYMQWGADQLELFMKIIKIIFNH
jgi:hypothetical protein